MEEEENKIEVAECCKSFWKYHWRGVVSFVIPIIFLPILLKWERKEFRCLYLVCVLAFYWITETIPLYVSSLLPIVILPAFGILDSEKVCMQYFKDPLVMFLTGLMVALAIEYSKLHERLALKTILLVGSSPRRLFFGIIMITAFISWWISNSATVAMMCPIVKGILEELDKENVMKHHMTEEEEPLSGEGYPHPSRISMAFYLGIGYASSIGGCATLIGTATNLTFKGIYDTRFKNSTESMDFPTFMGYCVPVVLILTVALWLSLSFWFMGMFRRNSKEYEEILKGAEQKDVVTKVVQDKYEELGPMTVHEIQVVILFVLMVCLLFTRSPGFFKGWADYFAADIRNSLPLAFVVIALFMLPLSYTFFRTCYAPTGPYAKEEVSSLITWKYLQTNVPWGILFLLGGGYALAEGSKASGMAKMIGNAMDVLKSLPPSIIQLLSIILAMFMTAFSSNVAIANIIIPVLCEMAVACKVHPLYLVYPAGIACSMAFHLPVSTPPNAIVAGYAHVKTKYMASAGILPTVSAILFLWINGQSWHLVIYPNSREFPDWAREE